jgi:hypothetical protein
MDKMERLMDMHRAMMADDAKRAFNVAMGEAQAEMPQILRDATNTHTKSRYATLEAISKRMNPIITKHGFSLSFGTGKADLPDHYRVTCEVEHIGGHTKHYHADVPSDAAGSQGTRNKNATQAFGSTMTYGRRYLKMLIFDVATTNEDDDGIMAGSGESITDEHLQQLRELIEEKNIDIARFCKFLGVEALPDLPDARFKEAVDAINNAVDEKRRGK